MADRWHGGRMMKVAHTFYHWRCGRWYLAAIKVVPGRKMGEMRPCYGIDWGQAVDVDGRGLLVCWGFWRKRLFFQRAIEMKERAAVINECHKRLQAVL